MMRFICPLITVTDIKRSLGFYKNVLGQTVKYDFGENITFEGDFAIHLSSHFSELINKLPITNGGNNFELYFEEDNIEEAVQTLKDNNVTFIHEMIEQPWKQRVVRFYDPDKNIIEIGESMEHVVFRLKNSGLSDNEISKATQMPIEFINASIYKFKK